MEEVSFICRRSLVSTKPLKAGKKIPFSPLDLVMEKQHIKMVYYYATPKGFGVGEITRRLREAMVQMLTYFHKVTGRLIKDEKGKWMIKCNDAGVRMVEAKAKGSVETWLENVDQETEKRLIDWHDMFHTPYFWATFYLQVTEFEEGGMAVGLACSHLLADPLSAALFIKAWADIALCGKMLVPPFFHPLPQTTLGHKNQNSQPNTYLINHYKSILECSSPSPSMAQKPQTISLAFTGQMVQACMSLTDHLNGPINELESTPFTALATLLWACISRVKEGRNGLIDMSLCFDVRRMLGLDKGYFGNCMVYTQVDGEGIGVDDTLGATRAIREAIEKVNKEGIMELIEWLEDGNTTTLPIILANYHKGNPIIMNLENMNFYSSLFVEGYDPIRVSCYIEPFIGNDKILVLQSHPREGTLSRVVMVTLSNDEVVKLCEDKLLARFSPTIQMGPRYNVKM